MRTLIVTDEEQPWFDVPDATVLPARHYLAEPDGGLDGGVRVLNLCRTGRYQGRGYSVSLLAEASRRLSHAQASAALFRPPVGARRDRMVAR